MGWFYSKQPCLELVYGFQVFLRQARALHDFGVSLRLETMISMVSRVKQSIWKNFISMEPDLESFRLWLENWIWKVKKRKR